MYAYTHIYTHVYMYQSIKRTMDPITLKVLIKYKINYIHYSNCPYQNLLDCGRLGNSNPNLSSKGQGLLLSHGKCIGLDLKHRAGKQGKEKKEEKDKTP